MAVQVGELWVAGRTCLQTRMAIDSEKAMADSFHDLKIDAPNLARDSSPDYIAQLPHEIIGYLFGFCSIADILRLRQVSPIPLEMLVLYPDYYLQFLELISALRNL